VQHHLQQVHANIGRTASVTEGESVHSSQVLNFFYLFLEEFRSYFPEFLRLEYLMYSLKNLRPS
jgi:hypothetical protein